MERSGLSTEIFGTLANGETVEAVTLTNANGMSVKVIGYGASIQPVCVPDAQGRFADVTTGLQRWMNMLPSRSFMGPPLALFQPESPGASRAVCLIFGRLSQSVIMSAILLTHNYGMGAAMTIIGSSMRTSPQNHVFSLN